MPHGSSVGVVVLAVLEHVGHSVGGAQVGHGGGVAHVTGDGQVHTSHAAQQLSQAGGSAHVVGSHVAVKYMIMYMAQKISHIRTYKFFTLTPHDIIHCDIGLRVGVTDVVGCSEQQQRSESVTRVCV